MLFYFLLCYMISTTGVKKYEPCRDQFVQSNSWHQNFIIPPNTITEMRNVFSLNTEVKWITVSQVQSVSDCVGNVIVRTMYLILREAISPIKKFLCHLTTVPIKYEFFYLPISSRLNRSFSQHLGCVLISSGHAFSVTRPHLSALLM